MGISIKRVEATGLAECKICKQKIPKGMVCVYVVGYRQSAYCHANEKDCGGSDE